MIKNFCKLLLLLVCIMLSTAALGSATGGEAAAMRRDGAASPTATGWQSACLNCPHYFTEMSGRAAVLDSQERVHIAYGGRQLYYAGPDGAGGWEIEVVDETIGSGRQTTLALDHLERPHILYQTADSAGLNHAYYDGANWQISALSPGSNPWLVTATDGTLRATFKSGGLLKYAVFEGNSWQIESVAPAGGYPSLALDDQQQPHVAYTLGGQIYHATFDGLAWQLTAMPDYMWSNFPAIAVTGDGDVHIVHSYEFTPIVHRQLSGGVWQTEIADVSIEYPFALFLTNYSLVPGNNGQLYLAVSAYVTPGHPYLLFSELHLTQWDGNAWESTVRLASSPAESTHASLVLNNQNEPFIAHKNGSNLAIVDANGKTLIVDRGGLPGGETSLLQDPYGTFHALYHDGEGKRFRYLTTAVAEGPWTEQLNVQAGFHAIPELTLALGPSSTHGQPSIFILYDDYVYHGFDIYYRYFDGQHWSEERSIRSLWGVRFDAAIDAKGNGHVVTIDPDFTDGHLYFASHVGGDEWISEVVDVAATLRPALEIDQQNLGRIAYRAPEGLRYAQQTASGWVTETVAVGAPDYISLALDADDRPSIAWYDETQSALNYAFNDGNGWQVGEVDDAGDVGQYASLALDSLGRAHIAYYDAGSADLKYAYQEGDRWHVETLVSEGDVGSHCALLLIGHNYPHIAYLDRDQYGIMLLYRPLVLTETVYLPLVLHWVGGGA